MTLTLTNEQAADLGELLDSALRDLSFEIADTDNARYRAGLRARRDRLGQIREVVRRTQGPAAVA